MRRIHAVLLSAVIVVGILGSFAGCMSRKDDSVLKQGQWLAIVNEAFGMDYYSSEEPHVKNISTDNEYFTTVQIAHEWGLIAGDEFDTDKKLTKGYAAFTLVKAVGFAETANQSDQEIAQFAADNGYISYSYNGEKDYKKVASKQEYEQSLDKAKQIWLNPVFENKEEVQYKEGVVSLADDPDVKSNAEIIDNQARIPMSSAEDIKVGDVYLLPANIPNRSITNNNETEDSTPNSNADGDLDINTQPSSWQMNNGTIVAYKAEKIEYADGYAIITNTEGPLTIEDSIQEMHASGKAEPDLTSVPFTDGAGNIINGNIATTNLNVDSVFEAPKAQEMKYNNQTKTNKSFLASKTGSFKFDGLEIGYTLSSKKIGVEVKGDIPIGKSGWKVTLSKSYDVQDISVDYGYDIDWFKLNRLYAKVNYTTVDKSGFAFSWEKIGKFYQDNRRKFGLSNVLNAELKEKAGSDGTKTIKIGSFPLVTNGVGTINLDVKLRIKVSGEIQLVVTTTNSKGIEYKNGNLRFIKEEHRDVDLELKAKLEFTLYIGVSIRALGINLFGVGIEGGIGAQGKIIIHLVDTDNVEVDSMSLNGNYTVIDETLADINGLSYEEDSKTVTVHPELCFDIEAYWILRFTVDTDSAIYKLADGMKASGGIKFSEKIEIFGKDNAKIKELCRHWEDGKKVDECTRKYGKKKDSETTLSTSNSPQSGEILDISEYYKNLFVNDTFAVNVTELPKGYEMNDVNFESSNIKIATVDQDGLVKALSVGTTSIIVTTKDKKFSVQCSVAVDEHVEITFTPLIIASV